MPLQVVNQSVNQNSHPDLGDHVDASGPLKDRRLKPEDLPDAWREPVFEADNFIIEGPASVEIVDRTGQQIQMGAVADALQRFIESDREPGIISVEHDDVPVGVPLWSWQADDGTSYETVVQDDEFRLVANIGNETTKSKMARARCLSGDYSGYSVTVFSNQEHQKPDGTRVTVGCDLHAVTLGAEELLANPAADFEVVDFKAGGLLAARIQHQLRRRRSLAGTVEQKLATEPAGSNDGNDLTERVLDRLQKDSS